MSTPHQLSAVLLNCTLKKSPATSNTAALLDRVAARFQDHGVATETIRIVDHFIPHANSAEAVEEGDAWPTIRQKVIDAEILILATPIWGGVRGSVLQKVYERLDGDLGTVDDQGQTPYVGKVAGCVVTGNEDGAHDVCANTLYNMTHLGFTVPPYADCYWVGPAGPGNSYIEARGEKHVYSNKTTRYLAATLTHYAGLLKANPVPINYADLGEQAQAESDPTSQQFFPPS